MKVNSFKLFGIVLAMTVFVACNNDDSTSNPTATIVKTWTVHMNAANELSVPAGRTDSGTAVLTLYNDDTLQFQITTANLGAGDAVTASHIHSGDAVSNGPVYIPLTAAFSTNPVSGTIQLTAEQADFLQHSPMYVNVHSNQSPGGIMRGQIE